MNSSRSNVFRMGHYKYLFTGLFLLLVLVAPFAQTSKQRVVYLSYEEAQPVVSALDEILPAELKGKNSSELASAWPKWIMHRDAEIRDRLALGDEDSLVNLLLFGTSYTKERRVTPTEIARLAQPENRPSATEQAAMLEVSKVLQARADELIQGMVAP